MLGWSKNKLIKPFEFSYDFCSVISLTVDWQNFTMQPQSPMELPAVTAVWIKRKQADITVNLAAKSFWTIRPDWKLF